MDRPAEQNRERRMNQKRRAELQTICRKLRELQRDLDKVQQSECAAYARIPKALQNSPCGAASQSSLQIMEYAMESLKKAIADLGSI